MSMVSNIIIGVGGSRIDRFNFFFCVKIGASRVSKVKIIDNGGFEKWGCDGLLVKVGIVVMIVVTMGS